MSSEPVKCCHCGALLVDRGKIIRGKMFNPWTLAYECRPKCDKGIEWYATNTTEIDGVRSFTR
jgi:hypothetical protein